MDRSRREFMLGTAATLFATRAVGAQSSTLTAQDVVERIRTNVGVPWRAQSLDGIRAGDPSTKVTGIATTVLGTFDALKRAAAAGQNLIVTQEPTFYAANDEPGSRAKDPVYLAKKAFIDEQHLVIVRFAEHWNARQPSEAAKALAATLKWTSPLADAPQIYQVPETTLSSLIAQLRSRLPIRGGLRSIGQPEMRVRTVFLAPGTTSLAAAVTNLARADVVLAGEPREWEVVPYTLDTWASDRGKGMIAIGRMISEGPGMLACAAWLRSILPELRVESIPVSDPYWSVSA